MMLVPKRSGFDLFDELFDDSFISKRERNLMKTDIKETKDKYIIDIDMPGFEKENINLSLNDGYLEISAKIDEENSNDDEEKFVHKERFFGECSRKFYVGDIVEENDINAEFKNGILKIEVLKKEKNKELPETKRIEIK